MHHRSLIAVILVIGLVACAAGSPSTEGPDTPVGDNPGATPAEQPGVDGTLTVSEEAVDGPAVEIRTALASGGEPVRVAGALFVDGSGTVLLCSALAESFPPQCGGERLRVVGLDPATVEGLQEAGAVRWAEGVELKGTVE